MGTVIYRPHVAAGLRQSSGAQMGVSFAPSVDSCRKILVPARRVRVGQRSCSVVAQLQRTASESAFRFKKFGTVYAIFCDLGALVYYIYISILK